MDSKEEVESRGEALARVFLERFDMDVGKPGPPKLSFCASFINYLALIVITLVFTFVLVDLIIKRDL